jgi:phytoene dehydrogenase-like protein
LAPLLYRDLVGEDNLPPRFVSDLDHFEWDDATIKVNWALDSPIPWTAPGARGAGTVHLGADLAGLRMFAADVLVGRIPEDPFLLLAQMQMSTADPARSPAGTESAWAYTHMPRELGWDERQLDAHVQRIERVFARNAPGFSQLIPGRSRASGLAAVQSQPGRGRHQRRHRCRPPPQLFFRPTPGLGRADTPIGRLFLAGASAHPGGAVHGGPGANAARAALAANGKTGPAYRAVIRAAHRRIYR